MTNPFTGFAFATTDTGTVGHERTTPDRLIDIHNVKDYGATGNGITDDWAAIMAAYNFNRYTVTAAASNLTASFTGVVSSAAFNGTIAGNNLTINGPIGTVGTGRKVWGQGVTLFQIASGSSPNFVVTGSPQSVGPVAMQTNFGEVFSGTLSGNNLTVNSGAAGTVAIGQTISGSGVTSCKIVSGSGTSWVVDGSSQSVTSDITTNVILRESSVTGTTNVGDFLLNNGGTQASPSTVLSDTQITSVQGSGVYVLAWPVPFQTTTMQNFTSQAMMTVSPIVSLTSAAQVLPQQYAFDVNNSTAAGDGVSRTVALSFTPPFTTITFQSMGGLINSGDTIGIDASTRRGIIYFPAGNYLVSKPIDFTPSSTNVIWRGCLEASTVTGNFNDYVFSAYNPSESFASIENLNVVNTHATGGGIRLGSSEPGQIRCCTVTANRGINDYNQDSLAVGNAYFGSFEVTIEDCNLSPGANYAGSMGVMRQSDGPLTNCRFIGYETGFQTSGGEGAQVLLGNYFEKCGTAVLLNQGPDGGSFAAGAILLAGCWFKNNGTAIYATRPTANCTIVGLRIEGTNGQAPGGLNPQYGILSGQSTSGMLVHSLIAGVNVVGSYDVAGIYFNGSGGPNEGPTFMGVADNSSSPQPFFLDPFLAPYLPTQIACGARHIYKVAELPGGTDASQQLNVSDGTNGLGWGATVTGTGTHTTPYLVQWNGSNWTVMGK